jgi:Flp pilus assembly pilin Flp
MAAGNTPTLSWGGEVKQALRRLWKGNAGGSLVEYALLGAMIAIGVAAAVGELTHSVNSSLSRVAAGMTAGSKDGMVAGGGIIMLPDHRKWVPPRSQGSSGAATEVARVAASVEAAAVKTADEASQYAKSWSSLPHSSGTTGVQGAIVAGWTAAIPH